VISLIYLILQHSIIKLQILKLNNQMHSKQVHINIYLYIQ